MELRLGSTSTDSTPRDEISDELGRDGVEELGSDRDTKAGKIAQELASKTETLVDLERAIEVWVIDETLPSDGCAWFLSDGQQSSTVDDFTTYFAVTRRMMSETRTGGGGEEISLQVGPHDYEEVPPIWDLGFEEPSILDSLLRRVDRAGADDNEDSIIVARQNSSGIVASRSDGLLRDGRRNDFMTEQSRLNEGVVLEEIESEMSICWGVVMDVRQ